MIRTNIIDQLLYVIQILLLLKKKTEKKQKKLSKSIVVYLHKLNSKLISYNIIFFLKKTIDFLVLNFDLYASFHAVRVGNLLRGKNSGNFVTLVT